ncbi:MAG TPA: nuclear transport factor 2 family protein [Solirubrobacteraceae bacterium]|jgi:ketosteroid isomerase-like protein
MSQENVEIVRRGLDAFNRRDLDGFAAITTDDFVWLPALPGAVDRERFVGRAGIARYFSEISETWERLTAVCDDLRDLDHRVLALGRAIGRGSASGAAVETPLALLAEFRGNQITRLATFAGHSEALKAVGLEE